MNLLILDHFNRHGGAQEYILEIGLQLQSNGHKIFIPNSSVATLCKMSSTIESTGFEILGKSYKNPIFYTNFIKNIFQLRKFIRENGITHIHCNSVPALPLAKLVAGKRSISFTAHDFLSSKIKNSIIKYFANRVIAVSNSVKNRLLEKGVTNIPISVIYNGFYPVENSLLSINNRDKTVFAIIGRIEKWKGVHCFLKAGIEILKKHSNVEFIVYGYSEDKAYENKCKSLIKGFEESIKFFDFIEDKNQLFNSVDVVVNASIQPEPFGRTLVEAALHNKPVIGPNIAGPKEIILDNVSGLLFKSGDVHDLSSKMEILLNNKKQQEEMGKKGAEIAASKFSIATISQEFLSFITADPENYHYD